jgi:hypothetical protein
VVDGDLWLKSDAGLIIKAANGGNVEGAARALRLALTEHTRVVERVTDAVGAIESRTEAARQDGRHKWFNRQFRKRRLAAAAAGEHFMSYSVAQRRLRNAIASVAAGKITAGVVAQVFSLE